MVVGRNEAVEVAHLHDGADRLVVGDGTTAEVFLGIAHVLWLDFHAEACAHCHVAAILERHDASCGVVRRSRDVRSHGDGREEVACAPLHIDALQGIGVVAHPELVEVGQYTPVGTTATACTRLNGEFGIFCADSLAHAFKSAVILNVEVALVIGGEVVRAVVLDFHVGVPLYIVDFGIFRHQVVNHIEDEVLHLGVGEVEHHLCSATAKLQVALRCLYHPVGVSLKEFAHGVAHFRLIPYSELYAQLLSLGKQSANAVGQLVFIHHPVAER